MLTGLSLVRLPHLPGAMLWTSGEVISVFHKEETCQGCSVGTLFQPHSSSVAEPLAVEDLCPDADYGTPSFHQATHVACEVRYPQEPRFTNPQGLLIVTRKRATPYSLGGTKESGHWEAKVSGEVKKDP